MAARRTLALFLSSLLSVTAAAETLPGSELRSPGAVPGRIVVKYRPTVDACAHCLLKKGVPFAQVTGRDSLDHLNRALGVRGAHAVFLERHGLGARAATARWNDRLAAARARGSRRGGTTSAPDLSNVYILDLPEGVDVAAAAARYAADPDVEYAHPDHASTIAFVPDDPFFATTGTWGQSYPDLWGLHLTRADEAWDTATGAGTVVAVVDTGVDRTHPDLIDTAWTNPGETPGNGVDDDGNGYVDDVYGWDFAVGDADPMDEHGHGTHVAGIVAATGNNGLGVVGMSFGARVMAVRGLDANGNGFDSNLAAAMVYAAMNGADVINDSWGGPSLDQVTVDAVDTVRALGTVVVAAAGNSATDVTSFSPARIPGVIAVAASDPDDQPAYFSNFGSAISVAAPGVDVLSTRLPTWDRPGVVADRYIRLSGTSMAAPHVAALAGVLLSALPGLALEEVRWHLELNADQPGYPGYEGQPWNPHFGWGRIDAARVFDPPPVTTRFAPHTLELHQFAGGVTPDAAAVDVAFTTFASVPWTVTAPSWLVPSLTSGSGPFALSLAFDGTGVAPATTQTGTLAVVAPNAVDGGATLPVTAHAHSDGRLGGEVALHVDTLGGTVPAFGPVAASNGSTTVLVWARWDVDAYTLFAAAVDGNGVFSAPVVVASGIPAPELAAGFVTGIDFDIASDGQNFLVVWVEHSVAIGLSGGDQRLRGALLSPTGVPLSAVPLELASASGRHSDRTLFLYPSVAFDGEAYTVVCEHRIARGGLYHPRYKLLRVFPDGSSSRPRNIRPRAPRTRVTYLVDDFPRLACLPGRCLLTWIGTEERPGEQFVPSMFAVPIVNQRPVRERVSAILHNVESIARSDLRAGADGYLAAATRITAQNGGFAYDVIATRVTGDGTALEPDGIRVNRDPATPGPRRAAPTIAYDGSRWLVAFTTDAPNRALSRVGRYVFLTRLASDGSRLDDESEGLLVHPGATASIARVAAAPGGFVVGWNDRRHAPPFATDNAFGSIYAQRLGQP